MATNQAALNNYLENTLLIPQPICRAINGQGISAIDDLLDLTDQDIKDVCKNIRSPGGTIANPDAAVAGQPPTIPNRGIAVGFVYEKRLRQFRYLRWHIHRVQRDWAVNQATLRHLNQLWMRYELENSDEDTDPEYPQPLKKVEDVKKVIEDMDDWLNRKLGTCGSPLAYVTRPDVLPPGHADIPQEVRQANPDPGWGMPSLPDELIRRTRHDGNYFEQDLKEVWNMIRHVTHGGPGWNWVSGFARTKNGREAYFAFKKHYLGDSFTARTVAAADRTLETIFYDGKARNFPFEAFSEKLTKAFTELGENEEEYTDAKKVRKLLSAITDPSLDAAKTTVLATPNLRSDYDAALNFIAEVVDTKRQMMGRSRHISSVRGAPGGKASTGRKFVKGQQRGNKGGGNKGEPSAFDRTDPGRTYSPKEWRTLSQAERALVREAREAKEAGRKRKAAAVVTTQDDEQAGGGTNSTNNSATGGGVGNNMTRRPTGSGRQ